MNEVNFLLHLLASNVVVTNVKLTVLDNFHNLWSSFSLSLCHCLNSGALWYELEAVEVKAVYWVLNRNCTSCYRN